MEQRSFISFDNGWVYILNGQAEDGGAFSPSKVVRLPLEEFKGLRINPRVTVVLPSNGFFIKEVEAICPTTQSEGLAKQYEGQKNIPFSTESAYWDCSFWSSQTTDIVKRALIAATKKDFVSKYVRFLELDSRKNIELSFIPAFAAFYNATSKIIDENLLRKKDGIILAIAIDDMSTSLCIFGETKDKDFVAVLPKGAGNINTIWDIKEQLEFYFSKFCGMLGTVPITKEIKTIFLFYPETAEIEWNKVVEDELGVQPSHYNIESAGIDLGSEDLAGQYGIVLSYGAALGCAGGEYLAFSLKRERSAGPAVTPFAAWFAAILAGISLYTAGSYIKDVYLPIRSNLLMLNKTYEEYAKTEGQVRRLQKEYDNKLNMFEALQSFSDARGKLARFIKILAENMDPDMIVVELNSKLTHFDSGTYGLSVNLRLQAPSYQQVNDFVSVLRKNGAFKSVLPITSRLMDDNKTVDVIMQIEY